jgi:hypothetical protein
VFCIESITVDCLCLVNVSLNVLLKLSLIAIVAKPGGRLRKQLPCIKWRS